VHTILLYSHCTEIANLPHGVIVTGLLLIEFEGGYPDGAPIGSA